MGELFRALYKEMLSDVLQEELKQWVEAETAISVKHVETVSGGKNNRGYIVSDGVKRYFLKQYFSDDSQRFRREVEFSWMLTTCNVKGHPKLIASECVAKHNLAIFEHLKGQLPQQITSEMITSAAQFIADINAPNVMDNGHNLLSARGGLACPTDFLEEVHERLDTFQMLIDKAPPMGSAEQHLFDEFATLLVNTVPDVFHAAENRVLQQFGEDMLQHFYRLLSPSDFGFHNSIIDDKGQLSFVDFEYAGWDSAEKLITDFFAQPRFDINLATLPEFISKTVPESRRSDVYANCLVLLPMAHLKWALIFLNEFKHTDMQRREFSALCDNEAALTDHLIIRKQQLEKAKKRIALASRMCDQRI